jgi:hypothetical protein
MAKRATKVLPARKPAASRDEDSLLTRSAESLGRVIGSLQRQMQGTTKRLSNAAEDAVDALPDLPQLGRGAASGTRKRTGARKTAGSAKSGGARTGATARKRAAGRKGAGAKATAARKSSRSRKTSGRSR